MPEHEPQVGQAQYRDLHVGDHVQPKPASLGLAGIQQVADAQRAHAEHSGAAGAPLLHLREFRYLCGFSGCDAARMFHLMFYPTRKHLDAILRSLTHIPADVLVKMF